MKKLIMFKILKELLVRNVWKLVKDRPQELSVNVLKIRYFAISILAAVKIGKANSCFRIYLQLSFCSLITFHLRLASISFDLFMYTVLL